MKLNFNLETPGVVAEAKASKRGWNWFVELLVFVVMFFVVTIGEVLVMLPFEVAVMMSNEEYIAAATVGDMERLTEITMEIASSDILTIGMLFANMAMILLTMLFCKVIQKRKMCTLGFVKKNMFKEYGMGLGIGFSMFSVAVLLCMITGALHFEGFSSTFTVGTFILFGLGYMIQGMAEEVLCRSYFMVSIGRRYPMWVAVILNALFFAALHLGNAGISALAFVNLTLFGVFASVYFIKRGNIWGIGAIHSIWNFVQGNFYGIKVSGMATSCTVFDSVAVEGREWMNGGAFGLEGGLAVTIVLVAATLFMLTKPAQDVAVEIDENMEADSAVMENAVDGSAEPVA